MSLHHPCSRSVHQGACRSTRRSLHERAAEVCTRERATRGDGASRKRREESTYQEAVMGPAKYVAATEQRDRGSYRSCRTEPRGCKDRGSFSSCRTESTTTRDRGSSTAPSGEVSYKMSHRPELVTSSGRSAAGPGRGALPRSGRRRRQEQWKRGACQVPGERPWHLAIDSWTWRSVRQSRQLVETSRQQPTEAVSTAKRRTQQHHTRRRRRRGCAS